MEPEGLAIMEADSLERAVGDLCAVIAEFFDADVTVPACVDLGLAELDFAVTLIFEAEFEELAFFDVASFDSELSGSSSSVALVGEASEELAFPAEDVTELDLFGVDFAEEELIALDFAEEELIALDFAEAELVALDFAEEAPVALDFAEEELVALVFAV